MKKNKRYWSQAKKIIPGGNMFLSKRLNNDVVKDWPIYFSKSKDCYVWDLYKRKYVDLGLMGVGTNVLGFNNNKINKSVIKSIKFGNMSSLNSLEELQLAKLMIKLHKWADMAKFAKTGGEANALAIRIARAYTKTDKVAVCGYHGWHDWYLAANLKNKNSLKNHLSNNLKISGVPKVLKNTVFTFEYNNFEQFKKIIEKNKIKIVKMEVRRFYEPKNNFLKKIRNYTLRKKIILIFDECTTGFRETLGGLHLKYKIFPDLAIFGKAIGNGYPITAVIGKRKIMSKFDNTFVSSTFWSERSAYVAALKTISIMKKDKTYKTVEKIGKKIKEGWKKISNKTGVNLEICGPNSFPTFFFKKDNEMMLKKLTKIMLKKRYLFKNIVYVSISHNDNVLKKYFKDFEKAIPLLKRNIN